MEGHLVSPIPKQLLASKSLQVSPTHLVAPDTPQTWVFPLLHPHNPEMPVAPGEEHRLLDTSLDEGIRSRISNMLYKVDWKEKGLGSKGMWQIAKIANNLCLPTPTTLQCDFVALPF